MNEYNIEQLKRTLRDLVARESSELANIFANTFDIRISECFINVYDYHMGSLIERSSFPLFYEESKNESEPS